MQTRPFVPLTPAEVSDAIEAVRDMAEVHPDVLIKLELVEQRLRLEHQLQGMLS